MEQEETDDPGKPLAERVGCQVIEVRGKNRATFRGDPTRITLFFEPSQGDRRKVY